jgi:hypothetical protein
MPMLIYTTDDYLYRDKRDIFVLILENQKPEGIAYDSDYPDNKAVAKEVIDWLTEHNIKYAHTVSPDIIEGWMGHYYVEFTGWDDPQVAEWSKDFENDDGSSKYPDKFRMVALSYDEWVDDGSEARHKQYLIDREDPDYNY